MKNIRRGPKEGYTSKVKDNYRHAVWESMVSELQLPLKENEKVLILPSLEGYEINVAIQHGIRPDQIIAIDRNKKLIDKCKWKFWYPELNYYACHVSEVHKLLKENGWKLAAANLDFCYMLGAPFAYEMKEFLSKAPLTKNFIFFTTISKGRETHSLHHKEGRVTFVHKALSELKPVKLLYRGEYIASKRSMIFMGFKVTGKSHKPLTNNLTKLMKTKKNHWTKKEDKVVINCVKNSISKKEAFEEADKLLEGRTFDAINHRFYTQIKPKMANAKTKSEENEGVKTVSSTNEVKDLDVVQHVTVSENKQKMFTAVNTTLELLSKEDQMQFLIRKLHSLSGEIEFK